MKKIVKNNGLPESFCRRMYGGRTIQEIETRVDGGSMIFVLVSSVSSERILRGHRYWFHTARIKTTCFGRYTG